MSYSRWPDAWDELDMALEAVGKKLREGSPVLDLVAFDPIIKDHYPIPGTLIKQYVLDERRLNAWENETCPKVDVHPHDIDRDDGEAEPCHNSGKTQWHHVRSQGNCETCVAVAYATRLVPDVMAWRRERAARPPICEDHNKFSDEVEPPWPALKRHPIFDMLPRKT